MNDMQKWLDVVNKNTGKQTLMEDEQLDEFQDTTGQFQGDVPKAGDAPATGDVVKVDSIVDFIVVSKGDKQVNTPRTVRFISAGGGGTNTVSIGSPIGKAFAGKKAGDTVTIDNVGPPQDRPAVYKITKVENPEPAEFGSDEWHDQLQRRLAPAESLQETLAAKLREFMEEPVIAERTGRKVGPAVFTNVEYQDIRRASQRGRFAHDFESSEPAGPNGERDVTFYTDNLRKLCSDLESIVDFGATSAAEVLDIDPHVVTENADVDKVRQAVGAMSKEDKAPAPSGPRYDYQVQNGGVILRDLHSGKDGYLQPGDEARTFFDDLEEWEAADPDNEFGDEFMEMYGYWSVIEDSNQEDPINEDNNDEVRQAVGAMSPDEVSQLQAGEKVNYYTNMARTFIQSGHDVGSARRDAEVEKPADDKGVIVFKVHSPRGSWNTVHEHVNTAIVTRSEELDERENTSSVEHRDEAGRFNVIYNYNRRQYKVHPMSDYEGLIEPGWFDSLEDAIEHAERELEGAGEGIDEGLSNQQEAVRMLASRTGMSTAEARDLCELIGCDADQLIQGLRDQLIRADDLDAILRGSSEALERVHRKLPGGHRGKEPANEETDQLRRLAGIDADLNEVFGLGKKKSQDDLWFDVAADFEIGNEEFQDSDFPQPSDFIEWAKSSGYEISQDGKTITKAGEPVSWEDFEAAVHGHFFGGQQTDMFDEETVNEDWGSSDWSAAINMMDRELESMGAVNPENIESAAQNVAEFYYEDMGYDHPDDAVDSIIAMYMQRKGWADLLGETAELKRLAGL